ncbi:MAG: Grx4 family monothiol glutaredoxin [Rhodanobacteraceae bacterium]
MTLAADTRARIDTLLASDRVVLFMKGTRTRPQCGFSAATVEYLDGLLDAYTSVDVLADEAIRAGIKEYGNWPTIPQLYVEGELVGGADIVRSLHDSGELHRLLHLPEPDRTAPSIRLSDAAAKAMQPALADAGERRLFLVVDRTFQPQFQMRETHTNDIVTIANGVEIRFDLASAQRARGARIDWIDTPQGSGLSIHLPLAPARVRALDVHALKRRLSDGDITVIDVRPASERALAPFAGAEVFEPDSHDRLAALPKNTPLAFLCHHGNSSRNAAEHFCDLGFSDVHNVQGGIDAWSREIDPTLPRY